ncbi:MAG: response regulator [Lachnospiraceae bacterium]|nr:response regulator [Lachnospiraceae bacterium]
MNKSEYKGGKTKLTSIRNSLCYCGLDREQYLYIRPLIMSRNIGMLRIASFIIGVMGLSYSILSAFLPLGSAMLFSFIGIGSAVIFLVQHFWKNRGSALILIPCYFLMLLVFFYGSALSCYPSNREDTATSIVVFLVLMPIAVIDVAWRMYLMVLLSEAGFLIASYMLKPYDVFVNDMANTVTCVFLGLIVYTINSIVSVREINGDVSNTNLKNIADEAVASKEAKSKFLAEMSHEIRTPVNVILGMNEMILRESEDESILSYATDIKLAGRGLLSIINSILDFSKLEEGKMDLLHVNYELGSLINILINYTKQKAQKKGLIFEVHVDEYLPSVLNGDDVRISQVIMNLLSNAVKYTEKGRIMLSMTEISRDSDSIDMKIVVSDTGIGIKKEDMGRLFETFERLDEEKNRHIEGTGLGISISDMILKLMGSKLEVNSIYGVGSEFSFVIKQTIVDSKPIGDYKLYFKDIRKQEENTVHPRAVGASVLVVDDNDMNLRVAKNLMKGNGIIPDIAYSGSEAIEFMRNKRYHIVFMDIMMPKLDGVETLEKLKTENILTEGTTMIALSANAIVGAKEKYLAAGFDDYLSKPIETDELDAMFDRYLPEEVLVFGGKTDNDVIDKEPPEREAPDERSTKSTLSRAAVARLESLGIDTETGLKYSYGKYDFYMELLGLIVEEYETRSRKIEGFKEAGDLREYSVQVHALKSSMKTLGATDMSETARMLEEAANNKDISYIDEHHRDFMRSYASLVRDISDIIA